MNHFSLIHTADWHLGARLAGQSREAEQRAFLDWLLSVLADERPDILLIAGDVFDSATPPVAAQEMYYRFLHRAVAHCRHIVVIGGNHDNAALLDAPRALLAAFSVHVIGASRAVEDEILRLSGAAGTAIIAAVPFLRERDVRQMQAGETLQDKVRALRDGIAAHYARVAELAEKAREDAEIPVIASGHLFAAGGLCAKDDGMRDIHVGNLAQLGADLFPHTFDYVALGHLHRAQHVGGESRIRYSGAPLALGFGDSGEARSLTRVRFCGKTPHISAIAVPVWQTLLTLHGTRDALCAQMQVLVDEGQNVWVEAHVDAATFDSTLHDTLQTLIAGSAVKLLRLHNAARRQHILRNDAAALPALEHLTPAQVFAARLALDDTLDEASKSALTAAFADILHSVEAEDAH